ncbi:MAG TPA: HAD family hydrolase, partial [Chloroflexi bacterium]|nr:HAD family hydrolase [Chloroflexota bacterium]
YLANRIPPDRLLAELMRGTQAMLDNRDPTRTLEAAFAARFYPALGEDPEELAPHFERFYQQDFPALRELTARRNGAREFVEKLAKAGYEIVIATNPLFPRIAIEERLRWAGLPPAELPFELITTYEDSHFAKPRPEYYAEILGRIGRSPAEAVMAGDDPESDLAPAQSLGMPVFHLFPRNESTFSQGDFDAFLAWLEGAPTQADSEAARSPQSTMVRLRAHVGALLCLVGELPAENWAVKPAAEKWAVVETISHLRDVEREVNARRLEAYLAAGEPHFSAFDTDVWAEERSYIREDGRQALQDFIDLRLALLDRLEALEPEQWTRKARHALFGPTTMAEIMAFAAEHDLLHLAQIRETLRKP